MTLVTRTSPPPRAQRITLTRTRTDTAIWSVRAAAAYRPPTRRRRVDPTPARRQITLTRTPRETFRWMLRGTPWGVLTIVGAIAASLLALLALWLMVPAIDSLVAIARAATTDAIDWVITQITAFPDWLGSMF